MSRFIRGTKDNTVETYEFPKRVSRPDIETIEHKQVIQKQWADDPEARIIVDPYASLLLTRLGRDFSSNFSDAMRIKRGVLGSSESFSEKKTNRYCHRYFEGNIYRYLLNPCFQRFIAFDDSLRERPKDFCWFTGPRVLLRRLVNRRFRLMASYTDDEFITNKNLYSVLPKEKVSPLSLLGVLNSKLVSYLYVKHVTQAVKDDFAQVTIKDISSLPCPRPECLGNDSELADLAKTMLDLHKKLKEAKTSHDKTLIQRQISDTDKQIDELVYELYGLTDEEIKIVEQSN